MSDHNPTCPKYKPLVYKNTHVHTIHSPSTSIHSSGLRLGLSGLCACLHHPHPSRLQLPTLAARGLRLAPLARAAGHGAGWREMVSRDGRHGDPNAWWVARLGKQGRSSRQSHVASDAEVPEVPEARVAGLKAQVHVTSGRLYGVIYSLWCW